MLTAQFTGRNSLRDVVDNFRVQASKLYHLGVKPFSRATLARCNEKQPHILYEGLFQRLLARCQSMAPRNKAFKLDGKIYLLDASMVELTFSLFPWAKYQKNKGAAKLHVGLDADGYLPAFVNLTEGKEHEIKQARELDLPRGSYLVFDRGYTDYTWYQDLTEDGNHLPVRHQCPGDPGQNGGRSLQRTLADRAFLQMDQVEPESEKLPGNFFERGEDPALDRPVCLSGAVVSEVPIEDQGFVATYVTDFAAQFFREARFNGAIQAA